MDGAGNQLLARAGFAKNQGGGTAGSHGLGLREYLLEGWTVTNDFLEIKLRADLIFEIQFFLRQLVLELLNLTVRPRVIKRHRYLSRHLLQNADIDPVKSIFPNTAYVKSPQRPVCGEQRNTTE